MKTLHGILIVWASALLAAFAADQVLFDFTRTAPAPTARTSDAGLVPGRDGLRVTTGTEKPWPGVTLVAPAGKWDLTAFGQVSVALKNAGANKVTVNCRVDNPGADGTKNCVTGSLSLNPGETGTLRVPLKRSAEGKLGGKLFGMRGYPHAPGTDARSIRRTSRRCSSS